MPYSAEHKRGTRQKILTSAARLFNRKGFFEVTIGEIMTAAGLTHGGFYRHFKSKDELYSEVIAQFCAGRRSLGRPSRRRDARRASPLRVMSSTHIYLVSTLRMSMAHVRSSDSRPMPRVVAKRSRRLIGRLPSR
jgi:AcrR family transcriptional regulator